MHHSFFGRSLDSKPSRYRTTPSCTLGISLLTCTTHMIHGFACAGSPLPFVIQHPSGVTVPTFAIGAIEIFSRHKTYHRTKMESLNRTFGSPICFPVFAPGTSDHVHHVDDVYELQPIHLHHRPFWLRSLGSNSCLILHQPSESIHYIDTFHFRRN